MGFDLSKKNLSEIAETGFEFELRLPGSGEKTGAFIKVRGDQSKIVKTYQRKKFDEMQARQRSKRKNDDITLEEAEDMAVESAVVRIISWKGIEEGGKEVPFSKEAATRILTEHSWIREAVQEVASEQVNFL